MPKHGDRGGLAVSGIDEEPGPSGMVAYLRDHPVVRLPILVALALLGAVLITMPGWSHYALPVILLALPPAIGVLLLRSVGRT